MDCIVCKRQLPNVEGSENQPIGGTEFHTWGHWGSAVTDEMGDAAHVVNVCDPCLIEAKANGRAFRCNVNRKKI